MLTVRYEVAQKEIVLIIDIIMSSDYGDCCHWNNRFLNIKNLNNRII